MSIEGVRGYLRRWGRDGDIIELDASTATVAEAAAALGVMPARIAKSISLKKGDAAMVVVTAGDMKLDNRKYKDCFGVKAKMLSPGEALAFTGHAVGGVCPFGLPPGVEVYLDASLKRFETVYPACGSANSAIELTMDELREYSQSRGWVDVCKPGGMSLPGAPAGRKNREEDVEAGALPGVNVSRETVGNITTEHTEDAPTE